MFKKLTRKLMLLLLGFVTTLLNLKHLLNFVRITYEMDQKKDKKPKIKYQKCLFIKVT